MMKLDVLIMPLLAVVMLLAIKLGPPLPAIYHDCLRHGKFMLPIAADQRFCIDNNRVVHFPGGLARW